MSALQEPTTHRTSGGGPSRGRRRWPFALALALAVIVLAVFAWPGGGGGSGPANAVAAAAEKTQQQPGGRASIKAIIAVPGNPDVTMTGRLVFNDEGARGVMRLPSKSIVFEEITHGLVAYFRSDAFGTLPGGKEWMSIDLSLGEHFEGPFPAGGDATSQLEALEAVGSDVQEVGEGTVRGLPTTRYRGTISPADSAQQSRENGLEKLASKVEEDGVPAQFEAWIDAEGLVRRMRITISQPADHGDGPTDVDMWIDFFDFGLEPKIEVPDPSEVFDATAAEAKSSADSSGD